MNETRDYPPQEMVRQWMAEWELLPLSSGSQTIYLMHRAVDWSQSQAAQWLPIKPFDSAPLHTDVLAYREDAGVFTAIYTSAAGLMSESETSEMDEDEIHENRWFAYCAQGMCSMDGDETPTHWMPLPAGPTPKHR